MFLAAFTSAWQAKPQAVHRKSAWLLRDFGSTCPHAEHRRLVNAGLTFSTRPGALSTASWVGEGNKRYRHIRTH
jgi:hypothetical protein